MKSFLIVITFLINSFVFAASEGKKVDCEELQDQLTILRLEQLKIKESKESVRELQQEFNDYKAQILFILGLEKLMKDLKDQQDKINAMVDDKKFLKEKINREKDLKKLKDVLAEHKDSMEQMALIEEFFKDKKMNDIAKSLEKLTKANKEGSEINLANQVADDICQNNGPEFSDSPICQALTGPSNSKEYQSTVGILKLAIQMTLAKTKKGKNASLKSFRDALAKLKKATPLKIRQGSHQKYIDEIKSIQKNLNSDTPNRGKIKRKTSNYITRLTKDLGAKKYTFQKSKSKFVEIEKDLKRSLDQTKKELEVLAQRKNQKPDYASITFDQIIASGAKNTDLKVHFAKYHDLYMSEEEHKKADPSKAFEKFGQAIADTFYDEFCSDGTKVKVSAQELQSCLTKIASGDVKVLADKRAELAKQLANVEKKLSDQRRTPIYQAVEYFMYELTTRLTDNCIKKVKTDDPNSVCIYAGNNNPNVLQPGTDYLVDQTGLIIATILDNEEGNKLDDGRRKACKQDGLPDLPIIKELCPTEAPEVEIEIVTPIEKCLEVQVSTPDNPCHPIKPIPICEAQISTPEKPCRTIKVDVPPREPVECKPGQVSTEEVPCFTIAILNPIPEGPIVEEEVVTPITDVPITTGGPGKVEEEVITPIIEVPITTGGPGVVYDETEKVEEEEIVTPITEVPITTGGPGVVYGEPEKTKKKKKKKHKEDDDNDYVSRRRFKKSYDSDKYWREIKRDPRTGTDYAHYTPKRGAGSMIFSSLGRTLKPRSAQGYDMGASWTDFYGMYSYNKSMIPRNTAYGYWGKQMQAYPPPRYPYGYGTGGGYSNYPYPSGGQTNGYWNYNQGQFYQQNYYNPQIPNIGIPPIR